MLTCHLVISVDAAQFGGVNAHGQLELGRLAMRFPCSGLVGG